MGSLMPSLTKVGSGTAYLEGRCSFFQAAKKQMEHSLLSMILKIAGFLSLRSRWISTILRSVRSCLDPWDKHKARQSSEVSAYFSKHWMQWKRVKNRLALKDQKRGNCLQSAV